MIETAFSADRVYRYTLVRRWQDGAHCYVNFILLNPSTADETRDDPTIRRCIGFAKREGFGALVVTNLFAYRSTDPMKMRELGEVAIGPENDEWLGRVAREATRIIIAWGVHGDVCRRGPAILSALRIAGLIVWSFGFTKGGHPKHVLYLPAGAPLYAVGIRLEAANDA